LYYGSEVLGDLVVLREEELAVDIADMLLCKSSSSSWMSMQQSVARENRRLEGMHTRGVADGLVLCKER
jgi:hypothetical protein